MQTVTGQPARVAKGGVASGVPGRFRNHLLAFLFALAMPPVAILLHELGHFLAKAAIGYELNRLTFASVVSGAPPDGVDAVFADGLSFAAGTGVSLAIMALALLFLLRFGANIVSLAVFMFESIRVSVGFVLHLVAFGVGRTFTVGFGEMRYVVRAFGGPGMLEVGLSWVELALPIIGLAYVLRRIPPAERAPRVVPVFVGLVAGLALWIGLIGPWLLP